VLERIKFYSKTHNLLVTNATAHLENLRVDLAARNEDRRLVRQEEIASTGDARRENNGS